MALFFPLSRNLVKKPVMRAFKNGNLSVKNLTICVVFKSLRFKPPGPQLIFRQIMEKASKHCVRARIAICHDQIKSARNKIKSNRQQLSQQVTNDTFNSLSKFLNNRARSVQNSIKSRHASKLGNLRKEHEPSNH